MISVLGYTIYKALHSKTTIKNDVELNIVYFLLALYPIAWWGVTANHAYIHRHFTCKAIAVSVMASLIILKRLISIRINNK